MPGCASAKLLTPMCRPSPLKPPKWFEAHQPTAVAPNA